MGTVAAVTSAIELDEILAKGGLVLVDFWAPWCGPCKSFLPVFTAAAEEYSQHVFVKVDADQCPSLSQRYGIRAIPTLLLFKDGELIGQKSGAMSNTQLKAFIEANDMF